MKIRKEKLLSKSTHTKETNTASIKDYRQLRNKIFLRVLLMAFIVMIAVGVVLVALLRGNFGNWVVFILEHVFRMYDYQALAYFDSVFRQNMDTLIIGTIIVVFLIVFYISIRWLTKYFSDINRGIDALLEENNDEIKLKPELSATERKLNQIRQTLAERKLGEQAAEQRKNDLVVYLAHDLKTPLTSVIGYLTLLRDEDKISEELRQKYLSISLDKAERLEELINEFFEITRFNLTKIPLEISDVNLKLMLEQIIYEFTPIFLDKNISCKLHMDTSFTINCDVDKMQRVFDNLLKNAVNYSFPDSVIHITVEKLEDNIIIEFANVGQTIPNDKLSRLFEQFYRLDTARTSKSGGSGLGLAISKEIVEAHGGHIKAVSENNTIIFEITLPNENE